MHEVCVMCTSALFYIHARDPTISTETWNPVINDLHKKGLFKHFGLSNFLAEDVEAVYEHC